MLHNHTTLIITLTALILALPGCKDFLELEVSEDEFDKNTPYPKFIPLEALLKEPKATITDEVKTEITTRRDDLNATLQGVDAANAGDPVLDRIDALRARQQEQAANDSVINDALRKRMEDRIKPPTAP